MSQKETSNLQNMTNEELEKLLETNEAVRFEEGERKCPYTEGPVGKKEKGSPWYDWIKDVQTACQLCGKPAVEKHYMKRSNANCYQWQCTETEPHADHKVEMVVWDCIKELGKDIRLKKTCSCG